MVEARGYRLMEGKTNGFHGNIHPWNPVSRAGTGWVGDISAGWWIAAGSGPHADAATCAVKAKPWSSKRASSASPGARRETPSGVPVKIKSPARKLKWRER